MQAFTMFRLENILRVDLQLDFESLEVSILQEGYPEVVIGQVSVVDVREVEEEGDGS